MRAVDETFSADDASLSTVLVVDDDVTQLELMGSFLARHFRVLLASDVVRAHQLVVTSHPDVVVSDLYMPNAGGMELLRDVALQEETAQIPFLMISGCDETELKVRAFQQGAFDYITKPWEGGELVARIQNAIRRSKLLQQERLLRETDDLTGISNRHSLRIFLAKALRESVGQKRPLSVVMTDQDGLKYINDTYGHGVGDKAIVTIARVLKNCKRLSDCAGRLGGDEFMTIMPGSTREGAIKFVARCQEELSNSPLQVGEILVQVSASFGIANVEEKSWEESVEELTQRADESLYRHKRARKKSQLRTISQEAFPVTSLR